MIPVTTTKDKAQLKAHALKLLKKGRYEGLVILINELQDRNFNFPETVNYLQHKAGGFPAHLNNEQALEWALQRGHTEIAEYLKEV